MCLINPSIILKKTLNKASYSHIEFFYSGCFKAFTSGMKVHYSGSYGDTIYFIVIFLHNIAAFKACMDYGCFGLITIDFFVDAICFIKE